MGDIIELDNFRNTLFIIPARGGSKRIPNKNLKLICDQPMIYWPLMELSKRIHSKNIIVSTDSENIISCVKKIGINVCFKRPKSLSNDHIGTIPVATHALKWFEDKFHSVNNVVMIYPTALMINLDDIDTALTFLNNDPKCDSIMSATTFPYPIQRAVYKQKNGYVKMFEPDNYKIRSQDFLEAYHDAGQFYVFKPETIRNGKTLVNSNVKLFLLDREKVIDIDTFEDLRIAEMRMKFLKSNIVKKNWKFKD